MYLDRGGMYEYYYTMSRHLTVVPFVRLKKSQIQTNIVCLRIKFSTKSKQLLN